MALTDESPPPRPPHPAAAVDLLARRVGPRVVLAAAARAEQRDLRAAARAHGRQRPGRVIVYVAFDDPCSAVAILGLERRLEGRDVELVVAPVVDRGIPGDPAVEAKREHALVDARRIARREGLALSRSATLRPAAVALPARWAAVTPLTPARTAFCVAALRRIWLESDGPVDLDGLARLWEHELGGLPPADVGEAASKALAATERRMRRRGPYDVPAAVLGTSWWFAHDRLDQIAERLDELGWTARA